MRVRYFY
ncbi:hypothetical protein RDI58_025997 [Solanum bulbocastanum]